MKNYLNCQIRSLLLHLNLESRYRKNIDFKIITSRRDSMVNYEDLVREYYKDVVLVDGEHDWLVADIEKTVEMILKVLA